MSKVAKRQPKKKPKKSAVKPQLAATPVVPEVEPVSTVSRKYWPFRSHQEAKPVRPPLTGAFRLLWRSLDKLRQHWQLFLGILLVYGVLNVVLVRGLASTDNLSSTKAVLNGITNGPGGKVSLGFTLFLSLLSGSNSSSANANAGVYQILIVIVVSLAVVWTLRQLYNNERVRIRDGFYRGMYPFVPYILVLLAIGLQLVPLLIGGAIYSIVVSNGIAVHTYETVLWAGLFFVLALASLYMVCSSIFALYIVTLPDMTPMKALRSARQLVRFRRFVVLRKLLFLPVALFVIAAVIIIPISLVLTPITGWLYFVLSLLGLLVIHSYMYALYRELLR